MKKSTKPKFDSEKTNKINKSLAILIKKKRRWKLPISEIKKHTDGFSSKFFQT